MAGLRGSSAEAIPMSKVIETKVYQLAELSDADRKSVV